MCGCKRGVFITVCGCYGRCVKRHTCNGPEGHGINGGWSWGNGEGSWG